MAPVARVNWSAITTGGWNARSRWDQVWLAIMCPAVATSRAMAGWAATWRPTIEKVAVTRYLASSWRTCGVYTGLGPSSMVSTMPLRPSWTWVIGRSPAFGRWPCPARGGWCLAGWVPVASCLASRAAWVGAAEGLAVGVWSGVGSGPPGMGVG